MKRSNALIVLSSLTGLLVFVYAALGLFVTGGQPSTFTTLRGLEVEIYGQGIYRLDTIFFAAGFRGTDMITVFLAMPLMALSIWLYARGSLRGGFLLVGSLIYCLYSALTMGTAAAYNPLFLLYTAAFTASVFALGLAWSQIDFAALPQRILPNMPRSAAAFYLCFGGVATALLWLSDLLPPLMQSGSAPVLLGPYTTTITYFIDLGIITPACLLAFAWLRRGNPRGYVLGFSLLYLLALMGCIVIGQTIFQTNAGVVFSTGQLIAMIGSWIVMGAIAVWFVVKMLGNIAANG